MTPSPNWLSRYREGRMSEVWHELRQLGSTIEPDLVEEAQLVCDEMALRARRNIEVIVERLYADGYRFHANDDEQSPETTPYAPPTAAATDVVDWLRERFGAVPMTLLSWVRLVGDVWLVGTHPKWPVSATADPLVIEAEGSRYPGGTVLEYFDDELNGWHEMRDEDPSGDPFVLPLAPDRLHKMNVSGGGPYGIVLPDGCVDGLFVGETAMPFVSYLRWVFGHGGFPWPTTSEAQWRVRHELAQDLLAL